MINFINLNANIVKDLIKHYVKLKKSISVAIPYL